MSQVQHFYTLCLVTRKRLEKENTCIIYIYIYTHTHTHKHKHKHKHRHRHRLISDTKLSTQVSFLHASSPNCRWKHAKFTFQSPFAFPQFSQQPNKKLIKLQQKKLKKKQSRITFRAGDSPRIILQKTQSFRWSFSSEPEAQSEWETRENRDGLPPWAEPTGRRWEQRMASLRASMLSESEPHDKVSGCGCGCGCGHVFEVRFWEDRHTNWLLFWFFVCLVN